MKELKIYCRNADGSGSSCITVPEPKASIDNTALQTAYNTYVKVVKIFPNTLDLAKVVNRTETELFDLI